MPTTIVCHDSKAVLCQEQRLAGPPIRAQGPSVRQGGHRALAPVCVVDRRAILHCYGAHVPSLLNDRPEKRDCLQAARSFSEFNPRTGSLMEGPVETTG